MIRRRLHTLRHQAGVSLIEVQLYAALFAVFIVVLSQLFANAVDLQVRNSATAAVDQEAKFVLQRLQFDGLRAAAVTTPSALGETTAVLAYTIGSQTYTYQVNNGVLELTNPEDTYAVTSPLVEIANFQVLRTGNLGGKHLLHVSFDANTSLANASASGAFTRSFSTVIGER